MRASKLSGVAVLSAALAMLPGQQLDAQIDTDVDLEDRPVSLSVRAGPSLPTADLADITEDVGAAFGAELAWPVAERVALTLGGNVDMLNGAVEATPDLNLWHYGAGLDLRTTPEDSPLSVVVSGGANATTMDSGRLDPTEEGDFTQTYFGLNAGLEIGYDITETVALAVRGAGFYVFADEEETSTLIDGVDGLDTFDRAITVPITAALSIGLN